MRFVKVYRGFQLVICDDLLCFETLNSMINSQQMQNDQMFQQQQQQMINDMNNR